MYTKKLNILTFTSEAEINSRIEEAKKEAEADGRRVMVSLYEKFDDLAGLSQPINVDVALSIIDRVSTERAKFSAMTSQLNERRKILNAQLSQKIQLVTSQTMMSIKEARDELENIRGDGSCLAPRPRRSFAAAP